MFKTEGTEAVKHSKEQIVSYEFMLMNLRAAMGELNDATKYNSLMELNFLNDQDISQATDIVEKEVLRLAQFIGGLES